MRNLFGGRKSGPTVLMAVLCVTISAFGTIASAQTTGGPAYVIPVDTGDAPAMLQPLVGEKPLQPLLPPAGVPAAISETPGLLRPASVDESETTGDVITSAVGEEEAETEVEPLKPIPQKPEVVASPTKQASIEPASFKGVIPGATKLDDVEKAWGAPRKITKLDGMPVRLYSVAPFNKIEVRFYNDTVMSIVIRFDKSFPASIVQRELELTDIRPVVVTDERGEVLGQVYPERGVLFAFDMGQVEPIGGDYKVSQIILEPITAEPFVLRAETLLDTYVDLAHQDLDEALKREPNNGRAHWLLARVLVSKGIMDKAEQSVSTAVRLEPASGRFHLTHARILGQTGRVEEAVAQAKRAVELSKSNPQIRAAAYCLLGDLTTSGAKPDYGLAIDYHQKAIGAAATLVQDENPAVRLAVKQTLVDAHLGAAYDVAWGKWKDKDAAVNRWLGLAKKLADDIDANESGAGDQRFRVTTRALGACVGLRGLISPAQWADDAIELGDELIESLDDPVRVSQLRWDLGMALYDALQTHQMRDEHELALQYGTKAAEYFEAASPAQQTAATEYLLGRLYFRLGAIYAIRDQNHTAAITWYQKAAPLLTKKPGRGADLGRHGETLVSMGVSYWKVGRKNSAITLTELGVELMEQAVQQGRLSRKSLATPYQNLVSMHRQAGKDESAEKYQRLVEAVRGTRTQ